MGKQTEREIKNKKRKKNAVCEVAGHLPNRASVCIRCGEPVPLKGRKTWPPKLETRGK